jgi:predicted phosphohydrolase
MSVETMILRFRDLSTNIGETIEFHKELILKNGSVWWGWWHKAGETVPNNTFQALMNVIDVQGALEILLFDTGTGNLYPATLKEIQWHPRFTEIDSPDEKWTPDYYGGRKLKVWFNFTSIGEGITDELVLREYSYIEIDELFERKKSIFEDFNEKQISSFEELRHQEKTIWFTRKFKAEDEIREILLYDTGRLKPSNFPRKIIENHSTKILWLSDLHFSNDHHAFALKDGVQDGVNLSEAIRKDLEKQKISEVGGVVITGDLTWKASVDEFALVRSFLDDVMSWSTLTPNKIIFCPGNHDIAFSDKPWEKGTLVEEAGNQSKQGFVDTYSDFFSVTPNEYLASGRRLLLANSFVVEIASLNSSYLRQTADVFQGQGFVGEQQLDYIANEMGWREQEKSMPKPFRMVLLHHHLVPVIPKELAIYEQQSSMVYDAGSLCNWIVKHRVDLVLHGHMHHSKVIRESRSLGLVKGNTQWHDFVVAALGSTGVDLTHNQLDRKNVYGLLEFSKTTMNLLVREIHSNEADMPVKPTIINLDIPYE